MIFMLFFILHRFFFSAVLIEHADSNLNKILTFLIANLEPCQDSIGLPRLVPLNQEMMGSTV